MYAPAAPSQIFGSQQPSYGSQFNQPFSQPFNQPVSNQPMPTASVGQSSIMNPQPMNTQFAPPGLPPIEVAQAAIPQNIQRNPTPPPGWNDPPALKSTRLVSRIDSSFLSKFKNIKIAHKLPHNHAICVNSLWQMKKKRGKKKTKIDLFLA